MSFGPVFRLAMIGLVALTLSACIPLAPPQPDAAVTIVQSMPAATLSSAESDASAVADAVDSAGQPSSGEATTGLANPASVNCTEQGGVLSIEKRGDGGEFGVCTFADNRQCEEWALLRGYCLVGGIRVTGFTTPPARHCAITGGHYEPIGDIGSEAEMGVCTLPDGVECDAWDYYNGDCPISGE